MVVIARQVSHPAGIRGEETVSGAQKRHQWRAGIVVQQELLHTGISPLEGAGARDAWASELNWHHRCAGNVAGLIAQQVSQMAGLSLRAAAGFTDTYVSLLNERRRLHVFRYE